MGKSSKTNKQKKAFIAYKEVIEISITNLKYKVRELPPFQFRTLTNGRLFHEAANLVLRNLK